MDSRQFKAAATSAIEEIVNYYDSIENRRVVSNVDPGYLKRLLPDGPPLEGEPWESIQKDIEAKILPGLTHWQSPNFMAFFPCNSSFPAMLGELYSAAFNAPCFNWICSPAVTELETIVLDWLAKLFNLPDGYLSSNLGGGVIHGSASEAVVTVMVAARDKYLRETAYQFAGLSGIELEDAMAHKRGRMVALGSSMGHSSPQKAAQIAGVRFRSIPVSAESGYVLTGTSLRAALEECKELGLQPFFLSTNLGSTSTCGIDDFASIASVASETCGAYGSPGELWLHVDAAYAGSSLICPEYHYLTSKLQYYHSYNINMHKWLLTNFDASLLYVQTRKHLINALSISAPFLRNEFSESGLVTDYRDWQIPFGRRFRSLKIWFVLRSYGVNGLQKYIRNHIQLGELFASLLKTRDDLFSIISGPAFALTTFNIVPIKGGNEKPDNLTKEVYEMINSRGEIYLTSTVVGEQYVIRFVSATTRTEEKYIRKAFDIFVQTAEEVRNLSYSPAAVKNPTVDEGVERETSKLKLTSE